MYMFKLFVANLDYDTTHGDLLTVVQEHCSDCTVDLPRDRKTGKAKGFAFIEAPTQEKQLHLLDKINNARVRNRVVAVKEYTDSPRSRMPRRDEPYNER